VLILALGSAGTPAQTSLERAVVRQDAALDAIVAADARLEVLKADYFGLLARPVWVREGQAGYLLFSDVAANAIYKWTSDGKAVAVRRFGCGGGHGLWLRPR
jgi:hypothetical protein